MNRFISWSRNKISGKKETDRFVGSLTEKDGMKLGSKKNRQTGVESENGKQEKVLMVQWKDEDSPDHKCLSQLSDDSAFSSSGCIVHSSQLDSDSTREDHNFNCSLDDHDDISDEELHQNNIRLRNNTDAELKVDSEEKSITSLSSQHKPHCHVHSQMLSVSPHTSFEKHELLRSTSAEAEIKKVRFRDRFRLIPRLGVDKERGFIDYSHSFPSTPCDLDSLDIWVSSSFCPKPESLVEVVRVDPFMKARILSFSGTITSSSSSSSSPSTVAILQSCSKNKNISFEKEFQQCLKKGPIKKAGKRIKYCFLFESFMLLTKQKFPSVFQLKHIVQLKFLWISLRPGDHNDENDLGDDNDEGVSGSFDNDGVCMIFNPPVENNVDNENEDGTKIGNDNGTEHGNNIVTRVGNDCEKEISINVITEKSQKKTDIKEKKVKELNGSLTHQNATEGLKEFKSDSLYVKKHMNWNPVDNVTNTNSSNSSNNSNSTNINSSNLNNINNSLCVLFGWINERIQMKRLFFYSETDKKSWIKAISRQQEILCSEIEKSLVVKVECYDKITGTRTKKLEVSRNDTMKEVLEKKGFSFLSHSLSDFTFGVKFVNKSEKYYLNGSESLFVLQLALNSNLLNGGIDCFTISQARASSISKQINSRRRRIKRFSRPELSLDFLAYKQSKAPMNKCRLFGCNLQELCSANDDKLPSIILNLLELLHDDGPQCEGIFRKSHNQKDLKNKVSSFNSYRGKLDDINALMAGAIFKYWLMKLDDCLLMSRFYFKWLEVGRIMDEKKQIEEFKKLSIRLPSCHLMVLRFLMCVLNRISSSMSTNMMSSKNLAVCMGPSLLKPSSYVDVSQEINSIDAANDVVEVMIAKAEEIFGKVKKSEFCSDEMCDDVWRQKNETMKFKIDDIVKFQSCENLDCGIQEPEKEKSIQRANSFTIKPSHLSVPSTLTPTSSYEHSSQDMSKEYDLEICQTFRQPKNKLYVYTDTTNTDDNISEGSFYQKPSLSMVKNAIFNNFVKNIQDENFDHKLKQEEIITEKNKNDEKNEDPKIPINLSFSEKTKRNENREDSKEVSAKEENVSSDSDTLTKGSCVVSNVNSPGVASSKTTFEYPLKKLTKKLKNKSTLEIKNKITETKISIEVNKTDKDNSFSNCACNITPSLLKSIENQTGKKISKQTYSPRSISTFSLKSLDHREFQRLPKITEAELRCNAGPNHSITKKSNILSETTSKNESMVEQQIKKFQECEKLLYNSLNKQNRNPIENKNPTKEKMTLIKPTPKYDLVEVKPRYVVEIDVGNFKNNNVKTLTNRLNSKTHQDYNTSQYKTNNIDKLRRNIVSSNISLADPALYTTNNKNLSYNQRIPNTIKTKILKSNSITPYYTNSPVIQSKLRSKTPTPQKSTYNFSQYPSPTRYISPKPMPYRGTSVSLDYPEKPQNKRFVTSVYLNSDATNDGDIKNTIRNSSDSHNIKVYNAPMYRSSFTLNF